MSLTRITGYIRRRFVLVGLGCGEGKARASATFDLFCGILYKRPGLLLQEGLSISNIRLCLSSYA